MMKRKLLTVALATTASVLGAFSAFAAEETYTEDGVTFTLNGDAEIVEEDDNYGNVLSLADVNDFIVTENGFLSDVDYSNGFAISLDICPTVQSTDWNYLWGYGTGSSSETYNYVDGTIGFISRLGDSYLACFPGDGWQDGNTVNSAYNYFLDESNCNTWYNITYVFNTSTASIYVDGTLATQWDISSSSISDILADLSSGRLALGKGIDIEQTTEGFTGLIDNVKVYNGSVSSTNLVLDIDFETTEEEESSEEESTSKPSSVAGDEEIEDDDDDDDEEESTSKPSSVAGDEEVEDDDDEEESSSSTTTDATTMTEAAVVTNADGDVLDVVLTVAVPDEEVAATAESLVTSNTELQNAGVSKFAVLDLTLTVDGTAVTLLDNKINVTVPVDGIFEDIASGNYVAVYRVDTKDDEEVLSYLGVSKVSDDLAITFATEHFSTYVFAVVDDYTALADVAVVNYVEDIDNDAVPDMDIDNIPLAPTTGTGSSITDNEDTGDTTTVMPLVVLAVVALGGVVAAVASKKRA